MKLLLKNGIVTDPKNGIVEKKLDVLIHNERIEKIGKTLSSSGAKTVDVQGNIVAPGFIDMHVHLREPGREDKETIATGTRSAARGGFTAVAAMANTDPSADRPTVLEYIYSRAKKEGIVHVFPIANITQGADGEHVSEIGQLKKYGAVALSDDGLPTMNMNVFRRAVEYASMFDLPILSHSQDMDLSADGIMNEGMVSTELGLPGQPVAVEVAAVLREIVIAQMTNHHVHFCHITTRQALEFIRDAKKRGIPITAETCPHYFTLTENDVKEYGSNAIMQPPLRTLDDQKAVIQYLQNDTLDVISTDHAPHLLADKYRELEEVARVGRGIVGLETSIPLVMTHLFHTKKLSVKQIVEKMSVNPAAILRLEHKGHLSVGGDADVTVIDPQKEEVIDIHAFESKGRNSPYHGWKMKGIPVMTIVSGRVVMRDRKIVA